MRGSRSGPLAPQLLGMERGLLAAAGFDAGVRIGCIVERDMVAVRLTPSFRWRVLGTTAYLARHGTPKQPEDRLQHQCIGYRFPTAKSVYQW